MLSGGNWRKDGLRGENTPVQGSTRCEGAKEACPLLLIDTVKLKESWRRLREEMKDNWAQSLRTME